LLVSLKRYAKNKYSDFRQRYRDFNRLNVCQTFPLFTPQSAGNYKDRAALTIQAVNQTLPFLNAFAASIRQKKLSITSVQDLLVSNDDLEAAKEIKQYFDEHGSDKASQHDYHKIYGPILKNRDEIRGVLEIGLGTNNTGIVSNMGAKGRPGASLRAFRGFLKSATIFGADVDTRILFEDERIKTFFVDQTNPATLAELGKSIPCDLDLIIDDGLHSPNANIATLEFGLSKIKSGGWVVIEDIGFEALPVWELVSTLLPDSYEPHIFSAEGALVFGVKRLS
jgi:hypothetical protein